MSKSNNEISREILSFLRGKHPQAVKFVDLFRALDIDEKALFKNLFFLEEVDIVQLMSSYPPGATYPTIHMVKIRDEGISLLDDHDKLNTMFPAKGFSSRLDINKINAMEISSILDAVSKMLGVGATDCCGEKESISDSLKKLSSNQSLSGLTLGKVFEKYS